MSGRSADAKEDDSSAQDNSGTGHERDVAHPLLPRCIGEPKMKTMLYIALLIGAITGGCGSMSPNPDEPPPQRAPAVRNNAYSLLYQLLNDERDVSKLLLIKRDSRELNRLAKDISITSGRAADQLKGFGEQDGALALNATDLPPGEAATRNAIAATKTKELLSSSGDAFERSFLLAQIEALNYAAHLATVAADNDPDPHRVAWSKSLSQEMKTLHSRCVELLSRSPHGR